MYENGGKQPAHVLSDDNQLSGNCKPQIRNTRGESQPESSTTDLPKVLDKQVRESLQDQPTQLVSLSYFKKEISCVALANEF